jgi:hypothetical protein
MDYSDVILSRIVQVMQVVLEESNQNTSDATDYRPDDRVALFAVAFDEEHFQDLAGSIFRGVGFDHRRKYNQLSSICMLSPRPYLTVVFILLSKSTSTRMDIALHERL